VATNDYIKNKKHSLKMDKKSAYYWFAVFAISFVAFQLIQEIRAYYAGENLAVKYFFGVAPNFFSAIGLPSLFVILIPEILGENKKLKRIYENRQFASNITSLVGLIIWEVLQLTGNLKFDWNDILWTILGALTFQLIWIVSSTKFKTIEIGQKI
jgi:hypothetical protein